MLSFLVALIAVGAYTVGILTDHLLWVAIEGVILIIALTRFLEGLRKEKKDE